MEMSFITLYIITIVHFSFSLVENRNLLEDNGALWFVWMMRRQIACESLFVACTTKLILQKTLHFLFYETNR